MTDRVWARVGQVGTAAAGLVAVVVAIKQFRQPEATLVYEVTAQAYAEVPVASAVLTEVSHTVTAERMARLLADAGVDTTHASGAHAAAQVVSLVQGALQTDAPMLEAVRGLLVGSVENTGSQEAVDVVLRVPRAIYASVSRDSGGGAFRVKGAIPLGRVRVHEKIGVNVWLGDEPDDYWTKDIVLSHTGGLGSVKLARITSGFPLWLDRHEFLAVYVLLVILILGLTITMPRKEARMQASEPSPASEAPLSDADANDVASQSGEDKSL